MTLFDFIGGIVVVAVLALSLIAVFDVLFPYRKRNERHPSRGRNVPESARLRLRRLFSSERRKSHTDGR
jgi:hypothetical protein